MRNRSFSSSTFRKTFLSYTAILLIPIIVFSVLNMYRNVMEQKRELHEKHAVDAKRIADSVDNKLNELKNFGKALGEESWVVKLMANSNVYDQEFDLTRKLEIRNSFQNTIDGLNILSFGVVIYPEKKLVFSPWGEYAVDDFMLSVAEFDEKTRLQFAEALRDYAYFTIMQPVNMKLWDDQKRVIPVLQSLEVVNNPRAVLLLFIDQSYFTNYLKRSGGSDYSEIVISDQEKPIYRLMQPAAGNSQEADATYGIDVPSRASNWQYTVTYPVNTLLDMQNLLGPLLVILISVPLGAVAAFLLAKISYRPLAALLRKLSVAVRNDDTGSEYNLIEKSFDRLMTENDRLQQAVQDYESAAKSNLLLRLLKGYFTDEQHWNELNKFRLGYTDEMFYCAMVISFHANHARDDADTMRKSEIATIMAADSVMTRHKLRYELFEVTNADKALIISSNQPFGGDGAMAHIASEMVVQIMEACGFQPDVFHGAVESGLVGISKSYYAANESLQVALFARSHLHDKEAYLPDVEYYYPTDWEVQMINNLKVGNLDTLTHILDEIGVENRKRQLPEASMAKLITLLMETMLRVLRELNIDAGIYAKQFENRRKAENVDAMWGYMAEVGMLICERVRYSNTPLTMEAGGKLLQYVNDNYTASDVSLKKLAELFQMSVSGVSKLFKEVTGINFYDYLCRLRMETAKELLRDKNSVDDVAHRVGYENVYSFKRAFVRYEGIKPDEYAQLPL
ncbi:helix-turn-helix transcriptional regulator [Cohnella soli]|uniref:Helix-turn-helix transcriptional regulator n=1 Tax=Cohnella soli TaxID=425005 RepID=A0ABW0I2C9_9BACL